MADIFFAGEIDLETAPMLAEVIDVGIEVGRRSVVLDLSGVTFIDSQGLRVLLTALKHARAAELELVLRSPSRRVTDLLTLAGVYELFTLDPPTTTEPTT
jgi:anti-sigma B factor antagonist